MPTTRRRRSRFRAGISEAMGEYLLTGVWPCDSNGERIVGLLAQVFLKTDAEIRATWREHRAALMQEWARRRVVGEPWGARFDRTPDDAS
jgi:hypothetical protein